MKTEIFANNVRDDSWKKYGPFEYVQLTYDVLRADPDGDRELAVWDPDKDVWIFDDDYEATDIAIGAEK